MSKSTQERIAEGRRLIIDFIGEEMHNDLCYREFGAIDYSQCEGFYDSWDWLIPAWSKFLQLITKQRMSTHPKRHLHEDMFRVIELTFRQAIFKDDPSEGCKVLSDAIKWYSSLQVGGVD